MTRKTSRRFANYSRPNEEQKFNEQPLQGQSSQQQQQLTGYRYMDKEQDNDSTIADMAQGFLQAQAKISDQGSTVNNLEIALLLQKCNNQLEEMRRSTRGNNNGTSVGDQISPQAPIKNMGEQKQDGGQGNKQQQSGMATQDLQGLLTTLLQGKGNNQNTTQESSTIQNKNNSNTSSGNQENMMAVQNVSQVLAQAQYELANELENSLKKLKQVIAESEKIANNISNLLGEEGTTKS